LLLPGEIIHPETRSNVEEVHRAAAGERISSGGN